jgi:hypothetical protein
MTGPRHAVDDLRDRDALDRSSEIADEIDHDADRVRDLAGDPSRSDAGDHEPHDLADDPDEVWFDADQLAAASHVDLGATRSRGDLLAHVGALEQLRAAMSKPGISLASLPGWPNAEAHGQGLGSELAGLIGELRPGDLVVFGGRARGVGRSSVLAQLGDGLALRPATHALTPVVWIVDAPPALWRARSLARWSGLDARAFVDADARAHATLAAFGESEWGPLELRQRFVAAAHLLDEDRRFDLLAELARWRAELAAAHGQVWPIVIVDPVEQLGDADQALARLAELAASAQLVVLASYDEHDDPARTRAVDRHASVRLRLSADDEPALEIELCHRHIGPRGRVRLAWHRPSGRVGCGPGDSPGY